MNPSKRIARVRGMSGARIESAADRFNRKHFPERLKAPSPIDAIRIFEQILPKEYGAKYEVSDELPTGLEGLTKPGYGVILSEETYELARAGNGRGVFTVCHEACHWLAHAPQIEGSDSNACLFIRPQGVQLARWDQIPVYENAEWQADRYAAALIAPSNMVIELVRKYGAHAHVLMDHFGMSRIAAEKRLRDVVGKR